MHKLKYTYVFCDIDDTLLTDNRKICEFDRLEIAKYINAGGNFVLTTGRNYTAAKSIYEQLNLNTPIIINQGYIFAPQTKTMLYSETLEHTTLERLCRYLEERNIYFQLFSNDEIYVKVKTHYSYTFIEKCGVSITETAVNLSDFISSQNIAVDKLMIECSELIIDDLLSELKDCFQEHLAITKSRKWIIEISSPKNTKGQAVQYFITHYALRRECCMAIGDSANDISMFNAVDFSVAVGNATSEAMENVHTLTRSNNNGGVGFALAKYAYAPQ